MGIEIERKFLVASDAWRSEVISSTLMRQGYLGSSATTIRIRSTGTAAFLTIKGRANGISRTEFEYPIPVEDAEIMLGSMTKNSIVEKIRYTIPAENGLFWEVDEYLNGNAPLFTAEIELPTPYTTFRVPDWLGIEVSHDKRYTNRSLSRKPYSTWDGKSAVSEKE